MRTEYPTIPVIGVEPALKPATLAPQHRRILVMATAATLRLGKFQRLEDRWGADSEVIEVPCVGLADLIEKGDPSIIGGLVLEARGQRRDISVKTQLRAAREALVSTSITNGGEA